MSVLTERASVAQKIALQEFHEGLREWLASNNEAVDDDGNQVLCVFAPGEAAEQMMTEVMKYVHPVLIASEIDGHVAVAQLGSTSFEAPSDAAVLRVDELTVADVLLAFKRASDNDRGILLELSLAGAQNLTMSGLATA